MNNYILKINFESSKHCFECPLCDEFDACIMQNNKEFDTIKKQMNKCPLIVKGDKYV